MIIIVLKDWALLPLKDIQTLKTLSEKSSEEGLEDWLCSLTSFEYQDELMYQIINLGDTNRVYYLKTLLFLISKTFAKGNSELGLLAQVFSDLAEKSKSSPKIVKYFDFLRL